MGLVSGLLLLPITGPVWGFRLFLERLRDEAEAVLHDEGRAFAELIDLSMRHNAGQLSEADFAEQEAELLERLSSIREYRDELLDAELDANEDGFLDDESDGNEDGFVGAGLDVGEDEDAYFDAELVADEEKR
jgi:hypothetical protein